MKNFKILIQYDGTRYKGWQVLKNTDATIQGKLQNILITLTGNPVEVIGSGRTDAGVHALGQVANFHLPDKYSKEELMEVFQKYLPEDIAVLKVEECDERFHSRYHAVEKTYCYRIRTGAIPNVFERKYYYHYTDSVLDVEAMRAAANLLVGTHDFASFCGNRKMKKSTVRTIKEIRIDERPDELWIFFTGDGFLQNMIRILVGTLIEVGSNRREIENMKELLAAKKRELAGYTAPPQGLTLVQVKYAEVGSNK